MYKGRKEERRREAQERQARHDSLSTAEKLQKLGNKVAKRERARLQGDK